MKKIVIIALLLSCTVSCADPLCGASEVASLISVRHFVEEESFEKRSDTSGSVDLFTVDQLPAQADLEATLASAPFETLDIGDHDIAPGTYIQCASLDAGEIGGLCSGFILQANEGVVVVLHVKAPDGVDCYSTKDSVKYTNVGPVSRVVPLFWSARATTDRLPAERPFCSYAAISIAEMVLSVK